MKDCPNCGQPVPPMRKYCSSICYQQHRNSRSRENVELWSPEDYEKFLGQEEMPCLVKGCAWKGIFVTAHMVAKHGIPAREVKEHCGFNITQGLITPALREKFKKRPKQVKSMKKFAEYRKQCKENPPRKGKTSTAISKQGREKHRKIVSAKLAAMKKDPSLKPQAICRECGQSFRNENSPYNAGKFCTVECRSNYYRRQYDKGLTPSGSEPSVVDITCAQCGKEFRGNRRQVRRKIKGEPVCCSPDCTQLLNGRKAGEVHRARRPKVECVCPVCQSVTLRQPAQARKRKYCSHQCAMVAKTGGDTSRDDEARILIADSGATTSRLAEYFQIDMQSAERIHQRVRSRIKREATKPKGDDE